MIYLSICQQIYSRLFQLCKGALLAAIEAAPGPTQEVRGRFDSVSYLLMYFHSRAAARVRVVRGMDFALKCHKKLRRIKAKARSKK